MPITNGVLDVVSIGRASVDVYGQQVGGRLEDMASFAKYIGGSPTNIAAGCAKLGLRSGLITRVGNEHMGRFIREQLQRYGVNVSGVITDAERLTALAILGIRDQHTFPLLFYRENCADMALSKADICESLISSSGAVVVTGTHFSNPTVSAASFKAMHLMRQSGGKVIWDIDYRPVLWGLTGKGMGEERFVASKNVTEHLQSILPYCDLVVGTEEEIHIAAGITDTLKAIQLLRQHTQAVIICKRGPMGCVAFPGEIPDRLEVGIQGPGFPVEVYNILGAGDSFMSGFLRGWLRNESLKTCCHWGNACGALAVSRHGCAPAIPSWNELAYFLKNGSPQYALRKDFQLEHIHWAANRPPQPQQLTALAFDHRVQLEALAQAAEAPLERISQLKTLLLKAAHQADHQQPFGVIIDDKYGTEALALAIDYPCWIGRPIERPAIRPLEFEGGPDISSTLKEWPLRHTVKCLVFMHPNDPADMQHTQEERLQTLFHACRNTDHQLLLELIPSPQQPATPNPLPQLIKRCYQLGIYPDWWKLKPAEDIQTWQAITKVIQEHDPECYGIVMLGMEASLSKLTQAFKLAAQQPLVKGFAIGRSIFSSPAQQWLANKCNDQQLINAVADNYQLLLKAWSDAKQ